MGILVAKDGERLEELYHQNHNTKLVTYTEFLKVNIGLLSKDLLDAGDVVTIVKKVQVSGITNITKRVTLW